MTEVSSRNGKDHASQVKKVLESIQAFQRDDDDSTSLRPEAQVFLETAHKYLECRKRMDATFESLPNAKVLEDFVLTATGSDDDYRQQSTLEATAQTLEEVYQAATAMKPLFEQTVNGIVDQIQNKIPPEGSSSIDVQFAPLKGRQRALEKAQNEYHDKDPGPDVAWLSDIVRGSVVFETVDQIILCLELIRDSENIQIVKA